MKALAAGGVLAGFGLWRSPVWAITSQGQPNVLAGTNFDLTVGEMGVNFTGMPRTAMTINGSLPGPILRWREGDTVTLRVRNRLKEDTSIHWRRPEKDPGRRRKYVSVVPHGSGWRRRPS